jgi:hypothetical protein
LLCEANRLPPVSKKFRSETFFENDMDYAMVRNTEKRRRHLRVPVLESEEVEIKQRATQAGMSVAAYLRAVGTSYQVRSIVDYQKVDEMAKVSADLGRLGGLLKLWLTNDIKVHEFGDVRMRGVIRAVLKQILDNQRRMTDIMSKVVHS